VDCQPVCRFLAILREGFVALCPRFRFRDKQPLVRNLLIDVLLEDALVSPPCVILDLLVPHYFAVAVVLLFLSPCLGILDSGCKLKRSRA
jgi:hypothetical protein